MRRALYSRYRATVTGIIALLTLLGSLSILAMPARAQGAQDTLILGLTSDTADLNLFSPFTNTVWKTHILGFNYERLFGYTPDYTLYPLLADPAKGSQSLKGWDFIPGTTGGLDIQVYIRPGVTFTDGRPMTADDVVFSYQTVAFGRAQVEAGEPLFWGFQENGNARIPTADRKCDNGCWPHFSGGAAKSHIAVEKVDDLTVAFHLKNSYALFFISTLNIWIYPKHVWVNHLDPTPPINLETSVAVTSADKRLDYDFGKTPEQKQATIGTGPMYLVDWTRGSSAETRTYEKYWGRGNPSASVTYREQKFDFFPSTVRRVQYKIFTSLDVATLALEKGEIHGLPWSVPPAARNRFLSNPSISIQTNVDSGFFYLAFNMRRSPWNNLTMRRAISMAIDKDYIVDRLLGGFGVKGSVPITIVNPNYVNTTAQPPAFNTKSAKELLDRDGFRVGADGWRETPDGRPIKASILTPFKDYDPVRADAGAMISKNLKEIGLNIESAPLSFNSLVQRVASSTADFDIFILGWSLSPFPENFLKAVFHSRQDSVVNLGGANRQGYRVKQVDDWIDQMLAEMNDAKRYDLVKKIQGKLVEDLPYNVLYDRQVISATRNDAWDGWVYGYPERGADVGWNFFSLSGLRAPGAAPLPPVPIITGVLDVRIFTPNTAPAGQKLAGYVLVSRDRQPIPDATVKVEGSWPAGGLGSLPKSVSVTTDKKGYAAFSLTPPFASRTIYLTATASSGTVTAGATTAVSLFLMPQFARLILSSPRPILNASDPGATGTSTAVLARVTDAFGQAMAGVKVNVDPLVLLGSISPTSAVTDASGTASFTYTAPASSVITNTHWYETIKADISVPNRIIPDTQSAQLPIGVQNYKFDWDVVTIIQPENTNFILKAGSNTTTLKVKLTDLGGTTRPNAPVTASLSNTTIARLDTSSNITDANGIATFTVMTATTPLPRQNVLVRFATVKPYVVSDSILLLISDGSALADKMRAAFIVLTNKTAGPNMRFATDATLTVYNGTGLRANATSVQLFLPLTDIGDSGSFVGKACTATPTPPCVRSSGASRTQIFNMFLGRTDVTGVARAKISSLYWRGDISADVQATIGGQMLSSQFHSKRAPLALVASATLDRNFLDTAHFTGILAVTLVDQAGPLAGSGVQLYDGTGSGKKRLATATTDALGQASLPVKLDPASSPFTPFFTMSVGTQLDASVFAVAFQPGYAVSPSLEFNLAYLPDSPRVVLTATPETTLIGVGQVDRIKVVATDEWGNPIQGILIASASSAMGSVGPSSGSGVTDGNGVVSMRFTSTSAGLAEITFAAYNARAPSFATAGVLVSEPVMAFSGLTLSGKATAGRAATIQVTIVNKGAVAGTETVALVVDGNTVATQRVTLDPGQSKVVSFRYTFAEVGGYAVGVGDQTLTVNAEAQPRPFLTSSDALGVTGLSVGILALILVIVGLLLVRRVRPRRPPMGGPPGGGPEEEMLRER